MSRMIFTLSTVPHPANKLLQILLPRVYGRLPT